MRPKGYLDYPILYISEYFEKDRKNYYKGLRLVDEHQKWVEWLRYFLKALEIQTNKTINKVDNILSLYDKVKQNIYQYKSIYAMNLLDTIFSRPIISSGLLDIAFFIEFDEFIFAKSNLGQ